MSKEREAKKFSEKSKIFAKKVLGWAIIIGGAVVGLQWFLGATAAI